MFGVGEMSKPRKLKSLTIGKKLEILKKVENRVNRKIICQEYDIPKSTLCTIIKNKDTIAKFGAEVNNPCVVKRNKPKKKVNTALIKWFEASRKANLPISGPILQQKALDFSRKLGDENFKASSGWLEKFKKRHGVLQKKACGESAAVNQEECDNWIRDVLPTILAPYEADDIFNADETGLFFKCLPDKTLTFKNEKCYGGKLSKERVTLLLAANMSGSEKLKPVIIGKSAKPRCFAGVKCLPLTYYSNKKAWMTSEIFEKWLLNLDKHFQLQNRRVLLLIDNCPAHPNIDHRLKAIKLIFFPPNTTSKLQPLDQGIIKSFKFHYKRRILQTVLDGFESNGTIPKIDLLDCIHTSAAVWRVDLTQETIQNCFRKAGFGTHNFYDYEDELPLSELKKIMTSEQKVALDLQESVFKCLEVLNADDKVSLEEYINVDVDLITSENPSEDEILEYVNNKQEDLENFSETIPEDDDEDDSVGAARQKPSDAEVAKAIETIRLAFSMNEAATDDDLTLIFEISKKFEAYRLNNKTFRQTLITDFF